MMSRIKVEYGFTLKVYPSLEESTEQSKADSSYKIVSGKTLLKYQFDGPELILEFDNRKNLVVSCGASKVDWHVTGDERSLSTLAEENVEFELPSGIKFDWNWKENLDRFVGNKLAISPSEQYLFLFTKNRIEYMIGFYSERGAPENKFLHISET